MCKEDKIYIAKNDDGSKTYLKYKKVQKLKECEEILDIIKFHSETRNIILYNFTCIVINGINGILSKLELLDKKEINEMIIRDLEELYKRLDNKK